jgi:hypothetical protein
LIAAGSACGVVSGSVSTGAAEHGVRLEYPAVPRPAHTPPHCEHRPAALDALLAVGKMIDDVCGGWGEIAYGVDRAA